MSEVITLGISLASLLISACLWWACVRKGTVKMTRPTMVFLGPDGGMEALPKIFLRTLLFSTAQRGCVIENMFLRLSCSGIVQTFSYWAYAEHHEKLSRGSGLFVGPQGSTYNHHFVVPKMAAAFEFPGGPVQIEVFAQLLGQTNPIRIQAFSLVIPDKLPGRGAGLMFDWNPETRTYDSDEHARPRQMNEDFNPMEFLAAFAESEARKLKAEAI
ncbi:hypothetical protein [Planctomicrobium piriforme]|uniref:Uncharacterized protein n=1 Tax=Planctomicrobium piriforme TaxID=1576369 RepID=A0A1I3E3M3_9PLAN|nr:hypothetical protein [Planctomicrobium piriforme]SFH93586.1 hypothetical protein SAMN05421753_10467 [Planctomicrobium piriforme]